MNKKWIRTTFRVRPDARRALQELSKRSGLKIKDLVDDSIKRASRNFQPDAEFEMPEIYRSKLSLDEKCSRVTFELTEDASNILSTIAKTRPDLNRDQIFNLMVYMNSQSLQFPLKKEREKLSRINRRTVRRIRGLAKTLEREMKQAFPSEKHVVFDLIGFREFLKSVEHLSGGIEAWSRPRISSSTKWRSV